MAYSNITLTTQTGLSFIAGEFIQLIHDSNNYMFGQIVSYNPATGSLTFTPTRVVGTGTYSTWEVIASGAAGNDGTSGTSGINGTSGTSGATGTSGASGTSGTSGTDGTSGSSGIDGTSGTSGLTGTSGTSGINGTSGVSGTSGTSGTDGATGSSGTAGTSGSSGVDGTSGTSGTSGINGTSGITPDPNARTETTITALAGQTTFTVSYTVGQVDVYYNGSKLAPAEFTATTGTDIVLATACQAGDIVDVLANITGGGVGGGGSAGNVAYFSSTNVIAGSNNLAWDNSSQYFTIGAPPTALANLHVYNPSAAASFLLQTNSITDYSEIAVRNYNSASTSYFRQYSASASGTVLGNSVAGLACFFSNYASNFAVGTLNGGDLILGTNNAERARILSSNGYFGIGTSSPGSYLDINPSTYNRVQTYFSGTYTSGWQFSDLLGGIWHNAANDQLNIHSNAAGGFITLTTNSSERFRVTSSGNVGIGTTSPTETFTVAGSVRITGQTSDFSAGTRGINIDVITASNLGRIYGVSGAGTAGDLAFGTANTERMRILSGGAIGMNTSSPISSSVLTLQETAGISSALNIINRNSTQTWNISVDASAVDDKYLGFIDVTNSAVRMVLGSNGYLGINTTSPSGLLSILTTSSSGATTGTWGSSNVVIGPNANSVYGAALGLGYNTSVGESQIMSLSPSVAWKPLSLFSSGLNINANNGTNVLTINDTGIIGSGINFRGTGRSGDGGTTVYSTASGSSNNVSNGTTTVSISKYIYSGFTGFLGASNDFYGICNDHEYGGPGAQLSIVSASGAGSVAFFVGAATLKADGSYQAPKVSYINTSGTYVTVSDKNKKKDFEISNIGLNEVLKLKPTLFRMDFEDENAEKQLGFIAQEVKEAIPQAYQENGSFIGLTDRPIIAALVKAIQEQQQQINELKSKIK